MELNEENFRQLFNKHHENTERNIEIKEFPEKNGVVTLKITGNDILYTFLEECRERNWIITAVDVPGNLETGFEVDIQEADVKQVEKTVTKTQITV